MNTKTQKKTKHSSIITLPEALNEFYQASNHKCDGFLATANDVLQAASKANSKLRSTRRRFSFLAKVDPCFRSMKFFADILDDVILPSATKPSGLVWGCLVHLLRAALRSTIYLEKVAEMFDYIGDFGTDDLRRSTFLTLVSVRQIIPSLYAWTMICCARAMKAIRKKREKIRPILWNGIIKPFGFKYDYPLSKFRQHRRELLSSIPVKGKQPVSKSDFLMDREIPVSGLGVLPSGLVVDREVLMSGLEREQVKKEDLSESMIPFMSWLQPPDYETALREAREHQKSDLISWVKHQREYIEWSQTKALGGGFLRIHGDKGIGKTPLAAAIVEDVEQRIDAVNTVRMNRYGLCYVFISSWNTAGESVANVLKCFVAQLMQQATGALSLKLAADSTASSKRTYDILRDAFVSLVKDFHRVHIIVDGLDHAHHPEVIANELVGLYDKLYPSVKLLVLSRAIALKKHVAGLQELGLPQKLDFGKES